MKELTYLEARDRIKNGDIVHVFRPSKAGITKTLIYSLIQFFTGSPIYHNVVAFWVTTDSGARKLMCVESNIKGGKRIIPLSTYGTRHLEVQPLPTEFSFNDMEELALQRVGLTPYGIFDFVSIGIHEFFGIKIRDFPNAVCSELCAELWHEAGFPIKETVVSPGRLKGLLLDAGIEVSISVPETDYRL